MSKIGVFDSGYGGLTVLKSLVKELPNHDFVYLGDNARAPYGNRSFDIVYEYTLQCVNWLFDNGCDLVILACNTASAKALRQIQQVDLPKRSDIKNVLGVIRPTTEVVGNFSTSNHVGIVGTVGTIRSNSYVIEIEKFFPNITVYQEACPIWVHLVENRLVGMSGTDFFVAHHLQKLFLKSPDIDTLILGCTHYPLLIDSIEKCLPPNVKIISQGEVVAKSLKQYLKLHPEFKLEKHKPGLVEFFTTEQFYEFNGMASLFYGNTVTAEHITLHL